MIKITRPTYLNLIERLRERILKSLPKHQKSYCVYGVPKNGSIIAESLSKWNECFIVANPKNANVIVDDLIDSGRTRDKYLKYNKPFMVLLEDKPTEWVHFWFEKEPDTDIEDSVVRILEYIGEDVNREGLKDTPARVVKMWKEIFRGYDKKQKPKLTVFDNGADGLTYDEMVIDEGNFYSHCEHHMVPFFGNYYFAYVPGDKILGISKVARLIDFYAAKLQVQERLVKEVMDDIEQTIKPLGCALVMRGEHLCKSMRGVKKKGKMTTIDLRGCFKNEHDCRAEFMSFVNKK